MLCFWAYRHARSKAAVVWRGEEHNWFTVLRASVYWAPLFHFCRSSYCSSATTDLPLKNRMIETFSIDGSLKTNSRRVTLNEDSVIKRGPSRHPASLSYSLSYFPALVADEAKKQGWAQFTTFFTIHMQPISYWNQTPSPCWSVLEPDTDNKSPLYVKLGRTPFSKSTLCTFAHVPMLEPERRILVILLQKIRHQYH